MNYKKGQGWGLDAVIGTSLFITGLVVLYFSTINTSQEAEEKLNELIYDGEKLADNILSEGYPLGWSENNVIKIGLFSNKKINETKLESFYNLSTNNYQKTTSLFNTRYQYYISASNKFVINGNLVDGIGNPPVNPQNLIRITRFTSYKNKPVTIYIDIWE